MRLPRLVITAHFKDLASLRAALVALRSVGGEVESGVSAGIFALFLNHPASNNSNGHVGFRCVFRSLYSSPQPQTLSLVRPGNTAGVGIDTTPTIRVSGGGVVGGHTVKLFDNASCSGQGIGSKVVPPGATSVDFETPAFAPLPFPQQRILTFYANATNTHGITSRCSIAKVHYTLESCPAGFVPVPGDSSVGTNKDFCVMKFEAKQAGGSVGVVGTGLPWVNVTPALAQQKCQILTNSYFGRTGFDLISNAEWMTIARNAEGVSSNWIGGSQNGILARGHSDSLPNQLLPVDNQNNPYSGTGNSNSTGQEQRRTLHLSNGEVIWDLSGNAWEWVDWSSQDFGFQIGPNNCGASSTELLDVNCAALSSVQFRPLNPENRTAYNSGHGLGMFFGGSGGAALRGGGYDSHTQSGAFGLYLNYSQSNTNNRVGFRCVYRPSFTNAP